jgi:hypothetical protein
MPRSRKTRTNLTASTNHRLNSYALAAGAAGVSLLALAQPAEAEIVYTPVHATIDRDGSYKLDLNNEGKVDFIITEKTVARGSTGIWEMLYITPVKGNEVKCPVCAFTYIYAEALYAGAQIGSSSLFSFYAGPGRLPMASRFNSRGHFVSLGSWCNVRDRYLGLKFQLSDGPHFGWARLSVEFVGGSQETWRAQITGYAYETIPGKQIKAGQITDDDATAQPGSDGGVQSAALSALALGSNGIALWRKSESSELLQK